MSTPTRPDPVVGITLERRAELWEHAVIPSWEARFVPALLDAFPAPEMGSVLVAECRTGYTPLALLERLPDEGVRCVAIDPHREMLDLARDKVPADERRVWWDAKSVQQLAYRDGVFAGALCTAGVITRDDLGTVAHQLIRLTRSGGHVGLVVPLKTTFGAFYDYYRDALLAHDLLSAEPHLDAALDRLFDLDTLTAALETAGLSDLRAERRSFEMEFESGQHVMLSPLVEALYLPHWLSICPDDTVLERILPYIITCMETYARGFGVRMTVEAAWVVGRV